MTMMMMIMIASYVDSVTTRIKSWLDTGDDQHKTTNVTVKAVAADSSPVDCIVCLSEVGLGERFAMLERCRHGFHVECVEAWLKDHPNCPLCKTPICCAHEYCTHNQLMKSYEIMSRCGVRVLEIIASWVTGSFSQGLQSSLSESCSYL